MESSQKHMAAVALVLHLWMFLKISVKHLHVLFQ